MYSFVKQRKTMTWKIVKCELLPLQENWCRDAYWPAEYGSNAPLASWTSPVVRKFGVDSPHKCSATVQVWSMEPSGSGTKFQFAKKDFLIFSLCLDSNKLRKSQSKLRAVSKAAPAFAKAQHHAAEFSHRELLGTAANWETLRFRRGHSSPWSSSTWRRPKACCALAARTGWLAFVLQGCCSLWMMQWPTPQRAWPKQTQQSCILN
jgi:hypothetical protein